MKTIGPDFVKWILKYGYSYYSQDEHTIYYADFNKMIVYSVEKLFELFLSENPPTPKFQKHKVCIHCLGVGVVDPSCPCTYSHKYQTIELEFEVCECCGHLKNDGEPAATSFNEEQLKTISNRNS